MRLLDTPTDEIAKEIARARKARRLAVAASRGRVTAADVASDAEVRDRLVALTGVREPSLATWAAVVAILEAVDVVLEVRGETCGETCGVFGTGIDRIPLGPCHLPAGHVDREGSMHQGPDGAKWSLR